MDERGAARLEAFSDGVFAIAATVLRAISRAFNPGAPTYALILVVAIFSPLASVALAAFYLPSSAFFER